MFRNVLKCCPKLITRWEEKRWRVCVYPQSQEPAVSRKINKRIISHPVSPSSKIAQGIKAAIGVDSLSISDPQPNSGQTPPSPFYSIILVRRCELPQRAFNPSLPPSVREGEREKERERARERERERERGEREIERERERTISLSFSFFFLSVCCVQCKSPLSLSLLSPSSLPQSIHEPPPRPRMGFRFRYGDVHNARPETL